MKKQLTILFLFFTCSFMALQAQIEISGVLTDEIDGTPLPSVNVIEKGTTNGTITDLDGKYTITVPSEDAILEFSFIGYQTEEVPVAGKKVINLPLILDIAGLQEVVVIGYGTQRKGDITSSVASVSSEDFLKGATQDVGQLIQGKVAGLTIYNTSGDPTSNMQVKLRGTNTLNGASSSPLILIDGIPGDFNSVAPEDIESMDILKDGSAAAIYGTKGANGVIIVTTKRASGKYTNRVSYSGYVSTSKIAKTPEMATAEDIRGWIADGYTTLDDMGSTTNWLDEITRDRPITQSHNVTFNGGSGTTNYLFNFNLKDAQGVFDKSDNRVSNAKLDVNHHMFDSKLKINIGGIIRYRNYSTTGDGFSFNGYTYRQAKIYNPTATVKDENGEWTENTGAFNYENPVARLQEADGANSSNWSRVHGSVVYEPIQGLTFKALGSYSRYNQTRGYYETKNHISTKRSSLNGFASNGSTETTDRLLELTANYAKSFDKHRVSVMGGYAFEDRDEFVFWQRNVDFPTDAFGYFNMGLGDGLKNGHTTTAMSSSRTVTNQIAFFGRTSYNFDDKYLFMGSLRYEAASTLYGTESPWGLFPSVSAGWRISKEDFMQGIPFLNDLKLRIGYGITGSQPTAPFLAVGTLGYITTDAFYLDGKWAASLQPTRNQNVNLKWEERKETNFGIDYAILNQRINGTLDIYNRKTEGLLFNYSVPVPPNLVSTTLANVGIMENKGVEFLVNIIPVQQKDFEWTTSFNFSTNKNKLVSLSNDLYESTTGYINWGDTGEPIQTFTHRIEEGGEVGNFYGFKAVDMTEDGKWVYEDQYGNNVSYNDASGKYEYEDANGNIVDTTFTHSDDDKHVLGNGLPDFYIGWSNTFRYKNFDLSVSMRGAFGFQLLNYERMYLENPTITSYNRLNTAFDEVYGKAILNEPLEYNSYYVEDGDYWKIDNITLGYNFKTDNIKYIQSARIYASSINTLTFTKYKGVDPEVQIDGLDAGNDYRDKYPTTRSFTVGVNVNF